MERLNITNAFNLYAVKNTSKKKNKEYYAIILKVQDMEKVITFITKSDYEFLRNISTK